MNNANAVVRNRPMRSGKVASLIAKFEPSRPEQYDGRVIGRRSVTIRGYAGTWSSEVCASCGRTRWSLGPVLKGYRSGERERGRNADVNRPAAAVSCRGSFRGVERATGRLELGQCPAAAAAAVPSTNTFVPLTLNSHPNLGLLRYKNIHPCLIPGNVRRLIERFERV